MLVSRTILTIVFVAAGATACRGMATKGDSDASEERGDGTDSLLLRGTAPHQKITFNNININLVNLEINGKKRQEG